MQALGIGVQEILQYCHALLGDQELEELVNGLKNILQKTASGASGEKNLQPITESCAKWRDLSY
jgi:hypothetical protein